MNRDQAVELKKHLTLIYNGINSNIGFGSSGNIDKGYRITVRCVEEQTEDSKKAILTAAKEYAQANGFEVNETDFDYQKKWPARATDSKQRGG